MRQPEASGTKGKSENNDVTLCAKHLRSCCVLTLAQAGMPVLLKSAHRAVQN